MSALAKALLAAQKEMPAIERDSVNPHFRNKYLSLDKLLATSLPILNKHGVVAAQFPTQSELGNPTLTTILMHESGERLEYVSPLFVDKQNPQGHGSAITYGRRQMLSAALGISDEKDDDGEAASSPPAADKPKAKPKAKPKPSENPAGDVIIPGGRHQGKTLAEMYRENPGYVSAIAKGAESVEMRMAAQLFLGEQEEAADDPDLPF